MMEIFNQPLSLWAVLASFVIFVLCSCLAINHFFMKSRLAKILACSAVALAIIALGLFGFPLSIDGMTCGISAGAIGWGPESAHLRSGSECIPLQEKVFVLAMLIQIVGIVATVTSLSLKRSELGEASAA